MVPSRQQVVPARPDALAVIFDATRRLLWIESPAQARRLACEVIASLGGSIVEANLANGASLPVDVSFGDGPPIVPVAPLGTAARQILEELLPTFIVDVRRALELGEQVDRFAEEASLDVLTHLANRRMVGRALGRLKSGDVVIMMDLDHFKLVNDTHGHKAGDGVLSAFGRTILSTIREKDFAGRYGGEEFVIILRGADHPELFMNRLRETWERERPRPITFSAGIALVGDDLVLALPAADHAMYRAKKTGRDQWLWAATTDFADDEEIATTSSLDNSSATFVAFSQLYVPAGGAEQIESAFRDRLGAVQSWPGFCSLEVWSDHADDTRYSMVSWWSSAEAFREYIKSPDHRRSHERIPTGELRPRAREFRRFRIVSR